MKTVEKGSFTLPGEAGYEELTLRLADRWGADVIRDSDGTVLSDEITKAGYGIYSTICIIRDHNRWAEKNQDKLQQCFLMTHPSVAEGESLAIALMDGFFEEQFQVNDSADSMKYWQVYDRTTDTLVDEAAAGKMMPEGAYVPVGRACHLTDGKATVLAAQGTNPLLTRNTFGRGQGIYLSAFEVTNANTRMLLNLILDGGGDAAYYLTDNAEMECAYYPESGTLVVINNADTQQECSIHTESGVQRVRLDAYDTLIQRV